MHFSILGHGFDPHPGGVPTEVTVGFLQPKALGNSVCLHLSLPLEGHGMAAHGSKERVRDKEEREDTITELSLDQPNPR